VLAGGGGRAGQQSLIRAFTWGFGGGQLIGPTLAVLVPVRAAAGGGPPPQFGEPVQALAAVAASASEPAIRAAETIAPAAARLIQAFGMTRVLPVRAS